MLKNALTVALLSRLSAAGRLASREVRSLTRTATLTAISGNVADWHSGQIYLA
jgi:hypothetical protein